MLGIQPNFILYPKKIFTNYLEKESFFCIFAVKLRVLFPFHYYKFEGRQLKADGRPPLAVRLDGYSHPTG
jgi:hypothetical protein